MSDDKPDTTTLPAQRPPDTITSVVMSHIGRLWFYPKAPAGVGRCATCAPYRMPHPDCQSSHPTAWWWITRNMSVMERP